MFERETRDRFASESIRLKLLRWRLILFFPLLLLGVVLALAWPAIAPLFRARSGSCTRLFSAAELAGLTAKATLPAPEVSKDEVRCDADWDGDARVTIALDDDGEFENEVWDLFEGQPSAFERMPGTSRTFVAVGADARPRLLRRLEDRAAYVDVALAPGEGVDAARKAAALLDDGRLARVDTGLMAAARHARFGPCATLLQESDVADLWSPPREPDLLRDWIAGDHTACETDVVLDAQEVVSLDLYLHLEGTNYADELEAARDDGKSVEELTAAGSKVALVSSGHRYELVIGVPDGVARCWITDASVKRDAIVALAGRLARHRDALGAGL